MTHFVTSDFQIVTCECFCYDWKEIKESKDESWKFDDIEKGKKTFRKFFGNEKTIFHCCYSCMEKAIFTNECFVSDKRYCIYAIKYDDGDITKMCSGCIWLFIEKNKDCFFLY